MRAFVVRDEERHEVELSDISSGACALKVAADDIDGYAEGLDLSLSFRVDGAGRPLFVSGVVRTVGDEVDDDGCVRVGVSFKEPEKLYAQLDERLWRFFNRRQAYRVAPDRSSDVRPVRVHLAVGDEEREDLLNDISTTGISLRVSKRDPVAFPEGEPVHVRFELPGCGEFRLAVRLVHDSVIRGSRRIGFRIDAEETEDVDEQQERILQYVLARQREIIRQLGRTG